MNEIDTKVLAVAQDYTYEHGKPPALILVHPEIAKRMTRTCFNFPKPPKFDTSVFWRAESFQEQSFDIIRVDVRILDVSHMQLSEYYQSSDRIECMSENQVQSQYHSQIMRLN